MNSVRAVKVNLFIKAQLLLSFESIWKTCIVASESWQQGMNTFLITAAAQTVL